MVPGGSSARAPTVSVGGSSVRVPGGSSRRVPAATVGPNGWYNWSQVGTNEDETKAQIHQTSERKPNNEGKGDGT